jgi:hypothetical protein
MRIATWNLNRPHAGSEKNDNIRAILKEIDADILVLTETNWCIDPGVVYTPLASDPLPTPGLYRYKHGENETTIWSKYPISRIKTYNSSVSVCAKVRTPHGDFIVYGTVIGILGNRDKTFLPELERQMADWGEIGKSNTMCIVGDFNQSFSDDFYFTKAGREKLSHSFKNLGMASLTAELAKSVCHIVVSDALLAGPTPSIAPMTWNDPVDKKLSDHKAVCVSIEFPKT